MAPQPRPQSWQLVPTRRRLEGQEHCARGHPDAAAALRAAPCRARLTCRFRFGLWREDTEACLLLTTFSGEPKSAPGAGKPRQGPASHQAINRYCNSGSLSPQAPLPHDHVEQEPLREKGECVWSGSEDVTRV